MTIWNFSVITSSIEYCFFCILCTKNPSSFYTPRKDDFLIFFSARMRSFVIHLANVFSPGERCRLSGCVLLAGGACICIRLTHVACPGASCSVASLPREGSALTLPPGRCPGPGREPVPCTPRSHSLA